MSDGKNLGMGGAREVMGDGWVGLGSVGVVVLVVVVGMSVVWKSGSER